MSAPAVIELPIIDALPAEIKRRVEDAKSEWTEADWEDLRRLILIMQHNVAVRHGFLK